MYTYVIIHIQQFYGDTAHTYVCVCVCVCVYMQDQHIEMSTSIIIIMLKHRSVTRHMHEYDACTSLKAGVAKHSLGTVVMISRMGNCLLTNILSRAVDYKRMKTNAFRNPPNGRRNLILCRLYSATNWWRIAANRPAYSG